MGHERPADLWLDEPKPVKAKRLNKNAEIRTFLHYSDPQADKQLDVFGHAKPGLCYNYSDRIMGQKWDEGCKKATEAGIKPKTARFYEAVLNHFHDVKDVNLQHIVLACNRSNGQSYMIFGYTYTWEKV